MCLRLGYQPHLIPAPMVSGGNQTTTQEQQLWQRRLIVHRTLSPVPQKLIRSEIGTTGSPRPTWMESDIPRTTGGTHCIFLYVATSADPDRFSCRTCFGGSVWEWDELTEEVRSSGFRRVINQLIICGVLSTISIIS